VQPWAITLKTCASVACADAGDHKACADAGAQGADVCKPGGMRAIKVKTCAGKACADAGDQDAGDHKACADAGDQGADVCTSFHESIKVHICALRLVLFVLYMVGYCMPRGGWCAEVPRFLGFAIYREA